MPGYDPFAALRGDDASNTNSSTDNKTTSVQIKRKLHCICKLPYKEDFEKEYLYYGEYAPSKVWRVVGGWIDESYGANSPGGAENTCATRVSYGFNKAGKLIPAGVNGGNKNSDGVRYILSARLMKNYLKKLSKPHYSITKQSEFDTIRRSMEGNQAFIMASTRHVAFVTKTRDDGGYQSAFGDIWFLPNKGRCNCG